MASKPRETLEIRCDFCLALLDVVNVKRFNSERNRDLMLAHKPACPKWSEPAAVLMQYSLFTSR